MTLIEANPHEPFTQARALGILYGFSPIALLPDGSPFSIEFSPTVGEHQRILRGKVMNRRSGLLRVEDDTSATIPSAGQMAIPEGALISIATSTARRRPFDAFAIPDEVSQNNYLRFYIHMGHVKVPVETASPVMQFTVGGENMFTDYMTVPDSNRSNIQNARLRFSDARAFYRNIWFPRIQDISSKELKELFQAFQEETFRKKYPQATLQDLKTLVLFYKTKSNQDIHRRALSQVDKLIDEDEKEVLAS